MQYIVLIRALYLCFLISLAFFLSKLPENVNLAAAFAFYKSICMMNRVRLEVIVGLAVLTCILAEETISSAGARKQSKYSDIYLILYILIR